MKFNIGDTVKTINIGRYQASGTGITRKITIVDNGAYPYRIEGVDAWWCEKGLELVKPVDTGRYCENCERGMEELCVLDKRLVAVGSVDKVQMAEKDLIIYQCPKCKTVAIK